MKKLLKKIIPKKLLAFYHLSLAKMAAVVYGHPSDKMIVVGVTGTKGKSTTSILIGKMLMAAGHKVGWTGTATFRVADREWLNDKKMTMLGRFALQKLLAEMVKAGCEYAVVETSSEGIAQFRSAGINYDAAILTNLSPEHLEAHGGFENYKNAKLKLFKNLAASPQKTINGKKISKLIAVNADCTYAEEFMAPKADAKIGFRPSDASEIKKENGVTSFKLFHEEFKTKLLGEFNLENIIAAASVCRSLGVPLSAIRSAVWETETLPGRMEFVLTEPFKVVVDYAHEPASTEKLYEGVRELKPFRVIQVFGGTGGGRDKSRRAVMGEMAARFCDIVVVTTDDPYDEDPAAIAESVAKGAENNGKTRGKDLFIEADRKKAIALAVSLARPGDVILVTGKGSEQKMAIGDKLIPWDDRNICREVLAAIGIIAKS
jgi:UDP-N-acetylmuramoyl-L-alanyl-D-glutamate--2,6-diaminopimelate ligase